MHIDLAAKPLQHWLLQTQRATQQLLERLRHTQTLWLEHCGYHPGSHTQSPGPQLNLASWQMPHLPPGTWGTLSLIQEPPQTEALQLQARVYIPELHLPTLGLKAKALGLQAQHTLIAQTQGPSQLCYTLEARSIQLAATTQPSFSPAFTHCQAQHLQLCLSYQPRSAQGSAERGGPVEHPHVQLFLRGITAGAPLCTDAGREPYPVDLDLRAWLFRSGVYRLDAGLHASHCQRPLGGIKLHLRGHCLKHWGQLHTQVQCSGPDLAPYVGKAFQQAIGQQWSEPLRAWSYTRWDKGSSKPSSPQGSLASIHGYVVLPRCRLYDIPLRGGSFYVAYGPGYCRLWDIDLWALQADAAGPPLRVQGSYTYQHADHRLLLDGQLWPSWIDRWMQDWWPELWQRFALGSTPPWGNVDVRFNLNDPQRTLVFGAARAQDFQYLQVPLSRCELVFYAKPLYFGMRNLRLVHAYQGSAQADIAWTYPHSESQQLDALYFDLHSDMPFEAVARASESSFCQQLSQQLRFLAPVTLQARGSYYRPEHPLWGQDKLELKASSWMPLTAWGVDLSYLDLSLQQSGTEVNLDPVVFGLCGGYGQGHAKVQLPLLAKHENSQADHDTQATLEHTASTPEEPERPQAHNPLGPSTTALGPLPKVQLWGSLEQVCYASFEQTLRQLHPVRLTSPTSDTPAMTSQPSDSPSVGGRLKLTLQGQGYWGDPHSFEAQGTLALREAQLGQIHLLGALSRILNKGPLGLGSLKFNELRASYRFGDQTLRFDPLHITGPTARLSGHGRYQLADQALAFRMQLHLLGGLRIPVVSGLLRLLDPFSKIFSLRLQGTLGEPQWILSPHFLPL